MVNDQVTTLNFLYCHEDPRPGGAHRHAAWWTLFGLTNSHLLWTREAYPTRAYQSLGNLAPAPADATGRARATPTRIPEGIGVGDPDRLVSVIERWESIGVTGINFLLNACETVPQAEVLASMRLFAAEVMPKFRPATFGAAAAERV